MLTKPCYFWFRLLRQTYPCLSLLIQVRRVLLADGVEQIREKVRFWILFYKLDFANLLAIAIDFIQPEFWI
ncbi:hypothetical protein H6G41_11050 [Tolypothrix sp. FACHB-123]|uniref:hypothetical protein n=1 Tax=Tolypothrix sp. FACHB-123 TaxID=2692868 RepID=UPI0016884199|nr:hypothetical protein [Tolypothrix sp. FACHB-123]MBD2355150.1 hypothetical protein [Tolypothrix sp. FACHB-123]